MQESSVDSAADSQKSGTILALLAPVHSLLLPIDSHFRGEALKSFESLKEGSWGNQSLTTSN